MQKALVLLSGGIDSMACAHLLKKNFDVSGLFINYGQAAAQIEQLSSAKVGEYLKIPVNIAKIELGIGFGVGKINGRNALLILSALASSSKYSFIAIGVHAGTQYYDCTEIFIDRINTIVQEYSSGITQVLSPFVRWEKPEIYEYCRKERLDLSATYSCEAGSIPPCGQCASCLDRKMLDASEKADRNI